MPEPAPPLHWPPPMPRSLAPFLVLFAMVLSSPAFCASWTVLNRRIEPNQGLGQALSDTGIADSQAQALISALQGVFDFKRSHIGDQFRLVLRDGVVDHFDYRQ